MKLHYNFDPLYTFLKKKYADAPFTVWHEAFPSSTEQLNENPFNFLILHEPNELFGLHNVAIANYNIFTAILTWSELILNNVDADGMMNGFDIELYNIVSEVAKVPIVYVGGGGNLDHYEELFSKTTCNAVGSASIFHFTQYTPLDIKNKLKNIGKPVRI